MEMESDVSSAADALVNLMEPAEQPKQETEAPQESTQEVQQEAKQEAPQDKADEQPQEPAQDKPKYKVKVQGDEMEVDLDELLNGYQRQADYTKKTSELAAQRKEIEAEREKLKAEGVPELQSKLAKYEQLLADQVAKDGQTDWQKMLEENPIEYLKQQRLADERKAELAVLQKQRAEENTVKFRQTVEQETAQLQAKRPEWKDVAKWNEDWAKTRSALKADGFADHEIDQTVDHRLILLADKARRYDELMTQTDIAAKKLEKVPPKVVKPGSSAENSANSAREAFGKLRNTGSVDDAAAALASLIG